MWKNTIKLKLSEILVESEFQLNIKHLKMCNCASTDK